MSGAVYRRICAVTSRKTVSAGRISCRANELCGAPDRQPTATMGPRQLVSLPSRVIVSRITAPTSVSRAPTASACVPASTAASVIAAARRM